MHDETKLKKLVAVLERAVSRLGPTERVARNSGRKAVITTLRKLRAALDEEFPVIPATKPRKQPRTRAQRVRDLQKRDYVEVFDREVMRDCVRLKVRIVYVDDSPFIPAWAAATMSQNEMRLAKKSQNMQASLAAHYFACLRLDSGASPR